MVAAPETKKTTEVVASKDIKELVPSEAESIKKSQMESEKPKETTKSEAEGSKDVANELDSR